MTEQQEISLFIRIISGIIGVLGFVAIAFNATKNGGFQPSFMMAASFFAGFIFLYVAFFGKYPWDAGKTDDQTKG